jgi:hypothetical protein
LEPGSLARQWDDLTWLAAGRDHSKFVQTVPGDRNSGQMESRSVDLKLSPGRERQADCLPAPDHSPRVIYLDVSQFEGQVKLADPLG